MLDTMNIGGRIKTLRENRGLTQNTFAEALNVSPQAVSNWERGIALPELDNLVLMASYFGVLVDDLLHADEDPLYLGIDGGGTKTEFAVTNAHGQVMERIVRQGCNPNDIGLKASFDVISAGIRELLVKHASITAVFCGISGITAGDHRSRMTKLLKDKFPSMDILVHSDSRNLFGLDDHADMAVICGTGSVVFIKNKGQYIRIGGWGHLFDSAGSAYHIGRDAVEAALAEDDFGTGESQLSRLLKEALGANSMYEAVHSLYTGGKPCVAKLASVVFEAYAKKDETAIAIIDKNAAWIANLINEGIRRYGCRGRVIANGGIFEHYQSIFLPHIRKYTNAEISVCDLPPVCGACRLSLKLAGISISENFNYNFKISGGAKNEHRAN